MQRYLEAVNDAAMHLNAVAFISFCFLMGSSASAATYYVTQHASA
ncbi:MAG: hypothetical protein R3C68_14365 [Myxococcota bacterium]